MDDFAALRTVIDRSYPKSQLEQVSDSALTALRRHLPGLPDHYLMFLQHIGWGSIGPGDFMFYSGPVKADEIFDGETAAKLNSIVVFGDNFSGWIIGFDTNGDWQIVGVDSSSLAPEPEEAKSVAEFLTKWIRDRE